jgi:predicted NBD/HSP70 family sugar kinase
VGVLTVEVGGTTLRAARFDPTTRRLSERAEADTPNLSARATFADVLAAIARLTTPLDPDPEVVALAYPGPLDAAGRALASPTVLGGTESCDVAGACAEVWPGARIDVVNDLSAAGYAYVSAELRTFAIVTVGSGIGHKVFIDGKPAVGPGGRGGEIGHLRVDWDDDALTCDCGGRGHLGGIASGRGALALYRRRTGQLVDGPALAAAFHAGEPDARAAVYDAATQLGRVLAALHLDTGVERIVVQGGFAGAVGEPYLSQVVEAARSACWDLGQDWSQMIVLGRPDDDAALLGAALHATGLLR